MLGRQTENRSVMAWQWEMGYKEAQERLRMIEIFYILTVGNISMYLFAKYGTLRKSAFYYRQIISKSYIGNKKC